MACFMQLLLLLPLLLPTLFSNAALYTPNKAGIRLDAPPGFSDSGPATVVDKPSRSASEPARPREPPQDVSFPSKRPDQDSGPGNSGTPFSEQHQNSPKREQRSPDFAPYVGPGYIDGQSQPAHSSGNNALNTAGSLSGGPGHGAGNIQDQRSLYNARPAPNKHPDYGIPPLPPSGAYNPTSSQGQTASQSPVYQQTHDKLPGYSNPAQGYPPQNPGYIPPAPQSYPSRPPATAYPSQAPVPGQFSNVQDYVPYSQYTAPQNPQNSAAVQYGQQNPQQPQSILSQPSKADGNTASQTPAAPQKPDFPVPFEFPSALKLGQNSPFGNLVSFNSPRPFKSRAPDGFPDKDQILPGFSEPSNQYVRPSESRPTAPPSNPAPVQQQNYPSVYASHASSVPQSPVYYQSPTAHDPRYSGTGGNVGGYYGYNSVPVGGGQCFQYTYAAEAYRLSDIDKNYPQEAIQKELDEKPYLAPLVGLEASKKANSGFNPFSFGSPLASQFDHSGFGFRGEESPADKYGYLLNTKAYPGNFKEGDFTGGYPSTMRPLDTSCPSQEYKLRSFFFHGGECYVVNPEFQLVTYRRCSRRECNFCGVNRGLSACVEDYRWFTVFAYCSKLQEQSRIKPLRLILPVGCTCQHFPC